MSSLPLSSPGHRRVSWRRERLSAEPGREPSLWPVHWEDGPSASRSSRNPRSVFRLSAENVPESRVPGIVPQSEILKTEKIQSHILCEAASHLFSLFYPHLRWLSRYAMSCDPVGCSPRGSSVCGILQARVENGLPLPSPRDLPEQVSCIAGGFLTSWAMQEALIILI